MSAVGYVGNVEFKRGWVVGGAFALQVAAALVAAFADRSSFIQRGRIAIACTSFSSNVTEQQREDLRMVIPLIVDDGALALAAMGAKSCDPIPNP